MAEKLVSAGVFTQENDLTYLPQGVAAIGAAIVGPTPKGPAFIPTLIETQTDYTTIFGNPDGKSYVPYTVQNYLQNAGKVTVVRIANLEGYKSDALAINLSGTTVTQNIIFQLGSGSGWATNMTASQINSSPLFNLRYGLITVATSASIDPSSPSWLPTLIGTTVATALTGSVFVSASNSSYATSVLASVTTGSAITGGTLTMVHNTSSNALSYIISATGSTTLNATDKTLCILALGFFTN